MEDEGRLLAITKLDYQCRDCDRPATFQVLRYIQTKTLSFGGRVMSSFCADHLPADARAMWEENDVPRT